MKRLLIATTLLVCSTAFAGRKAAPQLVSINGNAAYGSLASARNSPDTVQQIGCQVSQYSSGLSYGACWATDGNGKYVSCSTSNAAMVSMLRTLQGDNTIAFYWDTTGTCTQFLINSSSVLEPKQP
jgi:hypothetical protein